MTCEHKNTFYIPAEEDTNTSEDVICEDCNKSLIEQLGDYDES